MDLNRKGSSSTIEWQGRLEIRLTWSVAADFDLAMLYTHTSGQSGLVFFGEPGYLDMFPFAQLTADAGAEELDEGREESIHIAKPELFRSIRVFVWDYEKVQDGVSAGFSREAFKIDISDETGDRIDLAPDTDEPGNTLLIATILPTEPSGAVVTNLSKAATLTGLSRMEQLLEITGG